MAETQQHQVDGQAKQRLLGLLNDISSLYLNEKFSDVTFIVDEEKIHAHKAILAVRSEYFEKLLFGELKESSQSQVFSDDIRVCAEPHDSHLYIYQATTNLFKKFWVNEITIKDVSSIQAFKTLLKYIYSGVIVVTSSNIHLAMEVLIEAQKYCISDLEKYILDKVKVIAANSEQEEFEPIAPILNVADMCDFRELRDVCYKLLDEKAQNFLKSDSFVGLSQESLINLISRGTFFAPEIDVFKAVFTWITKNKCTDTAPVLSCIRLGWISPSDLVSLVRPTQLIDNNVLLNAISQSMNLEPKQAICRASWVLEKNVANLNEAEMIRGYPRGINQNKKIQKHIGRHSLKDDSCIILKLKRPYIINTIILVLYDEADAYYKRCYNYYVEVSADSVYWKKVADYRNYLCRGYQSICFEKEVVSYIRIVGTYNSHNLEYFVCIIFSASYRSHILPMVDGFIKPGTNIVGNPHGALVIEGLNGKNFFSLNGTDLVNDSTYHKIDSEGKIVVQLNQPFLISSMLFILSCRSRYYVEVSANKNDWEIVADFRNEDRESEQCITFPEKLVIFIRIVGTYSVSNDGIFRCCRFQCPAPEPNLSQNENENLSGQSTF